VFGDIVSTGLPGGQTAEVWAEDRSGVEVIEIEVSGQTYTHDVRVPQRQVFHVFNIADGITVSRARARDVAGNWSAWVTIRCGQCYD